MTLTSVARGKPGAAKWPDRASSLFYVNCECGPNLQATKRAFVRWATKIGQEQVPPLTALEVITALLYDIMDKTKPVLVNGGRQVVSTSEAGGSVTFNVPEAFQVFATIPFLEEIIEELEGTFRQIKRMRHCYNVASL